MANFKKALNIYYPFLVLLLSGLLVSIPLLNSGYFSHQDNLHIIRIYEMRQCFSDFQIPCRWVSNMGWGNGMPLFNFYAPLTYYVAGLLSFFVGFVGASKILFFLSLTLGSVGIYLLVKELTDKQSALVSSVLYMFAPYKALDIYVRGALTESFALAIIPFVFYFGYMAVVVDRKKYPLLTLSLFFFLITHNIMTVIFTPVVLLWLFYWQYSQKFNNFKLLLISLAISFGLSSFFLIPAFLEKGLVQTESLTRFELDYRANFLSVKQLFFDRLWGYGTSIPGPEGGMNFQIGWPHWILVVFSIVSFIFIKNKKLKLLTVFYTLLFLISVFMTHNKSTFIWERIPLLQFFQFPWRFLSLSIFSSSILSGLFIYLFRGKIKTILSFSIIISSLLLNYSYFKPKELFRVNDNDLLSGKLWDDQKKGALLDYLPKTALEPREAASNNPIVVSGKAEINNFINRSNKFTFNILITEDAKLEMPIFYFPDWQVYINEQKYISNHDNILGRISFDLPQGSYNVLGILKNTPLRSFANLISFVSLIVFLIWIKRINTRI